MIPSRLKLKSLSEKEVRKSKAKQTAKTCNKCDHSFIEALDQKREPVNGKLKTSP